MYLSLKNNFLSFKSNLNKKRTERIIEMINISTPPKSPFRHIIQFQYRPFLSFTKIFNQPNSPESRASLKPAFFLKPVNKVKSTVNKIIVGNTSFTLMKIFGYCPIKEPITFLASNGSVPK